MERARRGAQRRDSGDPWPTPDPAQYLERLAAAPELDSWKPHWLVIATDESLGDPIFLDATDPALPVYTVGHDTDWSRPERIADSLEGFVDGLRWVDDAAGGHTTPVELEARPLPDEDLERLIARIAARNPGSDESFWRSFFRFGVA